MCGRFLLLILIVISLMNPLLLRSSSPEEESIDGPLTISLPMEVWEINIFNNLNPGDLISLSEVCHSFRACITKPAFIARVWDRFNKELVLPRFNYQFCDHIACNINFLWRISKIVNLQDRESVIKIREMIDHQSNIDAGIEILRCTPYIIQMTNPDTLERISGHDFSSTKEFVNYLSTKESKEIDNLVQRFYDEYQTYDDLFETSTDVVPDLSSIFMFVAFYVLRHLWNY